MTHNLKIEEDRGHLIVAMFQIKQKKWKHQNEQQ